MAKLLVAALALFCLSYTSARQIRSTCELSSQYMEEQAMGCLAHDPGFMVEVIENMKNPQKMESMDFICENKKYIADLFVCMEKKLIPCLPAEAKKLIEYMPSKERLEDAMKLICEHKKEIINEKCMENPSEMQDFMQCYMGQVQALTKTASPDQLKAMICKVLRLEESCLRKYHGTCSKDIIEVLIQALEKLFPLDTCPAAVVDIKNGAFGNLLLHGQPLRFQPNKNPGYVIKA